MKLAEKNIKPALKEPFPDIPEKWTCSRTGLIVPKDPVKNLIYRDRLLKKAENDRGMQLDLLAACKESYLFWFNTFVWTFHQDDIDPVTHETIPAINANNPFITWEIQDEMVEFLMDGVVTGKDRGIKKSRNMGASWICVGVFHWLWQFRSDSMLLEMSRTEDYVDKAGNHKALFWKHDYINKWEPEWMRPPECLPGKKNRTKMHMHNELNNSTIDGESTTEHAGSGDRRLSVLLDEFAKVKNGQEMRSATADVSPCRIVNSTPAGAGTEYSRWVNSGQIKVFVLPYWEHPDKGQDRHVVQDPVTSEYDIRCPWLDFEETRRSPKEVAQEIKMQDIESGDTIFTTHNIDKHKAIFGRKARVRMSVDLKKDVPNSKVSDIIKRRDLSKVVSKRSKHGPLRVWTNLIAGRPDQSKCYIFGIDVSKGQGASNSVISIKCRETGEKIAEWADANKPPYDLARVAVALAIWCGGRKPIGLPFFKWEMNGPGWDFGKIVVKEFHYPHYYRQEVVNTITTKRTKKYGWHSSQDAKKALLWALDRAYAHGGYINHSIESLDEALFYIEYTDGGCGPASFVEESKSARKTHGDRVIADALTIEDGKIPRTAKHSPEYAKNTIGHRRQKAMDRKNKDKNSWRKKINV
jgi:hypothetical protein